MLQQAVARWSASRTVAETGLSLYLWNASGDNGMDRNVHLREDRAVVAMSGGVDSSVAAYFVKESGLDVIGITMQVWPTVGEGPSLPRRCCSLEAVNDAWQVAWQLGIPHYVLNFREPFEEMVVDPFSQGYPNRGFGEWPGPCPTVRPRPTIMRPRHDLHFSAPSPTQIFPG